MPTKIHPIYCELYCSRYVKPFKGFNDNRGWRFRNTPTEIFCRRRIQKNTVIKPNGQITDALHVRRKVAMNSSIRAQINNNLRTLHASGEENRKNCIMFTIPNVLNQIKQQPSEKYTDEFFEEILKDLLGSTLLEKKREIVSKCRNPTDATEGSDRLARYIDVEINNRKLQRFINQDLVTVIESMAEREGVKHLMFLIKFSCFLVTKQRFTKGMYTEVRKFIRKTAYTKLKKYTHGRHHSSILKAEIGKFLKEVTQLLSFIKSTSNKSSFHVSKNKEIINHAKNLCTDVLDSLKYNLQNITQVESPIVLNSSYTENIISTLLLLISLLNDKVIFNHYKDGLLMYLQPMLDILISNLEHNKDNDDFTNDEVIRAQITDIYSLTYLLNESISKDTDKKHIKFTSLHQSLNDLGYITNEETNKAKEHTEQRKDDTEGEFNTGYIKQDVIGLMGELFVANANWLNQTDDISNN